MYELAGSLGLLGNMKKILFILFVSLVVVISWRLIAYVQQDISKNGFYTIVSNEYRNGFFAHGGVVAWQGDKLIGQFSAHDDNLGIIQIPTKYLPLSLAGQTVFKLKSLSQNDWSFQGTYENKGILIYDSYPFGLPLITDSKKRTYQFEITSTNIDSTKNPDFSSNHLFTEKYVFPHQSTKQYPLILIKKISSAFSDESFWRWDCLLVPTLLFAFLLLGIFTKTIRDNLIKPFVLELLPSLFKKRPVLILISAVVLFFFYLSNLNSNLFFLLFLFTWSTLILCFKLKPDFSFKAAITVLLLIPVFIFLGHDKLSEEIAVFVWAFFIIGVGHYLVDYYFSKQAKIRSLERAWVELSKKQKFLIGAAVVLGIFGISIFFKSYYLGGDDTKFYYLYPDLFYQNFVSKIGPDTSVSSLLSLLPPTSIAPFILPLVAIKFIFRAANLQFVLYSLNIFFGVFFFYKFIDYLIPRSDIFSKWAKFLGALLYCFSIFNFYSYFNSQLLVMYLLSTFPLSMLLFIKAVREQKIHLVVICALISTIFGFLSVYIPWLSALFIVSLPLYLLFFLEHKKRFLAYSGLLIGLLILLNCHWFVYLTFSSVLNQSFGYTDPSITTDAFRKLNEQGIKIASSINSPIYPLLNSYHYDIQKNFNWPFLAIYESWYKNLLWINIFFIGIILWAVFLNSKEKGSNWPFVTTVSSLLIGVYFFTVNIGGWGQPLFIWLNNTIPGFVMFRNMYDKFAPAMAWSFALAFSASLISIILRIHSKQTKQILLGFSLFLIALNAKPFLLNEFNNVPIWTTKATYNTISGLNQDYLNLLEFVRSQDTSARYLELPLSYGNISQIQDQSLSNHYYNGLAPLLILTGKNDYSGAMSFGSFGQELIDDIQEHRYQEFGLLLRQFNVKYVIVNKSLNDELINSYIFGGLYQKQNDEFKRVILGQKIKDFGSRYSMYEINPEFAVDKIYLAADFKQLPTVNELQFKKLSSTKYQINIPSIHQDSDLVLLDPYLKEWEVTSSDGKQPILQGDHFKPFGYANGWHLNLEELIKKLPANSYSRNPDGTLSLNLLLQFKLMGFHYLFLYISIATFGLAVMYLVKIYLIDNWRKSHV